VARLNQFASLILVASPLLLIAASSARTQSTPRSEKHETSSAVSADSTNQNNQSALYAALIKALHAATHQEEAAAEQKSAENESLLTPLRVQKGLLAVGIIYSFFALMQWRAIHRQVDTMMLIEAPSVSVNFESHIFLDDGTWNPGPWIEYWFENHGRTPATLLDAVANFEFVGDVPPKPNYPASIPYIPNTVIVPPNGGKTRHGQAPYERKPGDTLYMTSHAHRWLFYGFVKYRDLSESEEIAGFGFFAPAHLQVGNDRGYLLLGNAEYNYRHKCKQRRWYQRFYKK
jgi:hypothetical protein